MFSEAYWVFSVGNLKGIFRAEYPNCWKSHSQCSSGLINSLTYTQVSFRISTRGSQAGHSHGVGLNLQLYSQNLFTGTHPCTVTVSGPLLTVDGIICILLVL